jgi:hypothetical protein
LSRRRCALIWWHSANSGGGQPEEEDVIMARSASDPTTRHPSQLLALVIGAVYTLVGIAGFFVTGFDNFAGQPHRPPSGRYRRPQRISQVTT